MTSRHRPFIACALGAAFVFAVAAYAELREEKVFPVNDNNAGLFDQPSVAMSGSLAHVAFIGDNTGTGYKVYYAEVNSGLDFRVAARDNTLILTPATAVDNAVNPAIDTYADARHPKIAVRSATEVVILFQAKPAPSDTQYQLYVARIGLSATGVASQTVQRVQGLGTGMTIEDASWALLTTDGTARVVYSTRTAAEKFNLSFARVGIDNASASPPVPITASFPASAGFRPIPNLTLDDLNRSHIAWAAEGTPGSPSGPIYYAMVKEVNGLDNMVIAPTRIMTRYLSGYSFPSVILITRSLVTVIASDEADGALAYVEIGPDSCRQDGRPATDSIIPGAVFWFVPPGEAILPAAFRLFRPSAVYESASGRIFMTGYGDAARGRAATFLAFKLNPLVSSADFVQTPAQFATDEPCSGIDNDYTQAAFGFPGGKVVVFWSGRLASGNRNLDVTTIPTLAAFSTTSESGCAMVPAPSRAAADRVSGALMLFLPAAALAARRLVVGRRRRTPSAGRTIGR